MYDKDGNSSRQTNYDLLRAISCITVVILHVSAIYMGNQFRDIVGQQAFLVASCFRVLSQMSVPCFVMLSGAFLLKQKRNTDIRSFYIKSAKKLGVPIVIFSILYVMFHYAENILGSGLKENYQFDVYEPLVNWLHGKPHGTMWYMYMIIPLYFITPFLVIVKSSVSRRVWYVLAVSMSIYGILVSYTCSLSWILEFAQWIGYFMIGDVISELGNERVDLKISRVPLICIALSYLLLFLYWYTHTYRTMVLSGPGFLSPFNVAISLLLFIGFAYIRVNDCVLIHVISKHSFYIYLLHPFLCEVLMQFFGRIMKWFPPPWMIPLYALGMTAVCILISAAISAVSNKISAKTLDRL